MEDNKFSIDDTINTITNYAPVVLFIMLLLTLVSTGYLQREYYTSVYDGILVDTQYIAFLFPVIIQTIRLITGFLSASFFKKRKFLFGTLVFIFSLWLTVFEHNEASHMGIFWTTIDFDLTTLTQIQEAKLQLTRDGITIMVRILVWSALLIELFLAFWLGMKKETDEKVEYVDVLEDFSSNGTVKTQRAKSRS